MKHPFRLSNILLAALCWCVVFTLLGCVMAGYDSDDITTTETRADGTTVVTRTKHRRANYTDSTQAPGDVAGFLSEFGGVGGILGALTGTQAVVGGGGVLALLAGGIAKLGHYRGQNAGWDAKDKEEKARLAARAELYDEERRTGRDIDGDGKIGATT